MKTYKRGIVFTIGYILFFVASVFSMPIQGRITNGKKGIPHIVVSDGYTVTTSGKDGRYFLNGNDSAKFVFISIPSRYEIPEKGGIPQFYQRVKGKKSATADFQLKKKKKKDKRFVLAVMADPQSQIEADMQRFSTEAMTDLEQLRQRYSAKTAFVGMTAGDLIWDAPHLYPDYVKAFEQVSYPWFQVIGNHDHDETVTGNDYEASHNYEKYLGPTYYSFNRGNCHFVALDNIVYNTRKEYETAITGQQLEWLRQDLRHVDKKKLILVGMHAPAFLGGKPKTSNIDALLALLEGYKVVFLSGHTHRMNRTVISDDMVEFTLSPTMGNSWAAEVCNDGCPNGYGVFEIKGNKLTNHYYKSIKQAPEYQFRLYPAGSVEAKKESVVAYVWNYSKGWKVNVLENGIPKGEMQRFTGFDPVAYDVYIGPEKPARKPKLEPVETNNLFFYTPEQPDANIKVIVTDDFGNVYSDSTSIATRCVFIPNL